MSENNLKTMPGPKAGKRQWRVGTLSMGMILIVFGLVLLLAQFNNFSAVELVSTWWPAVMIILGLEILAAHYFSGEDKPPIKYDLLSVFMVLLIGVVTFGLYALTSVGILPAFTESVTSQTYTVDAPEQRFGLQEGIKNIVVKGSEFNSGINSLYFQETDANEVVAFAQATVSGKSQEEADALMPEGLVKAHTVGDTLFLDLKSVSSGNHFQQSPYVSHTIVLPRDRKVQINADNGPSLKLQVNELKNNWSVASSGRVEVTVATNADIKIEAFARRLAGEGKWIQINTGQSSGEQTLVESPDGNKSFETVNGEYSEAKGKAGITFGKGSHKLEINADEVCVNDI